MQNCKKLVAEYKGGNVNIVENKLLSLEGCPEQITGYFNCSYNKLKSLMGGPKIINGDFACTHNGLTSLVGGPEIIASNYWCKTNRLTDLVGCASHIAMLNCSENYDITSLVGIHKIIKSCKVFNISDDVITDGGIGLLLISNLNNISSQSKPFAIIKQYLGTGTKGMMECSKELTAKGYAPYAKL